MIRSSEQDVRLKFLVDKGVMRDEQIIDLFVLLKNKFKNLSLSMKTYHMILLLSIVQKHKKNQEYNNELVGPHDFVQLITANVKDANIVFLPIAILLFLINNPIKKRIKQNNNAELVKKSDGNYEATIVYDCSKFRD